MGDAIDNFIADIPSKQRKWEINAIDPYAKAWIAAFESYKSTLNMQKEKDAAIAALKLKLAMIALSLCGGGLLTAAFGSAAAKTLATDAAIDIICRKNMENAFKAANFIATNKTASFIAGKIWDEAESGVSGVIDDAIKAKFAQNEASFPSIGKFRSELDMYISLSGFVKSGADKVNDIAIKVRDDNKQKTPDKLQAIESLKRSHFWNAPETNTLSPTTADEIELSMYLALVMDSDRVVTSVQAWRSISDGMGHGVEYYWKQTGDSSIEESPWSKSYPSSQYGNERRQDIVFTEIGDLIQDRMNELHRQKFGNKFIDGRSIADVVAILEAERSIGRLAATNIKKLVQEAAAVNAGKMADGTVVQRHNLQ